MLKSINLTVAFLLELCMLVALAYWGFQTGQTLLARIVLGLGAPVLAAVIWGRFMAPNSATRLTGIAYIALKSVLFGLAALGLVTTGQVALAAIFAVVAVVNQVLLLASQQETIQDAKKKNSMEMRS